MNATMDLLNLVQQHFHDLKTDVETVKFEGQEDRELVSEALEELETRFEKLQTEKEVMKQEFSQKMEDMQQQIAQKQDRGK